MSPGYIDAIDVQPGALLAAAPAEVTVEELNSTLAGYGLCLPIDPLVAGLSLSDLVACNVGGRRRLRYGPIVRYLRAARLTMPDGQDLSVGGPTLKRSTGYGLNRAIVSGGVSLGSLRELTVSLRPLATARAALELRCADTLTACRLAASLLRSGYSLSALALAEAEGNGLLLAELEGTAASVERQLMAATAAAQAAGARVSLVEASAWERWEQLARAHVAAYHRLDLTLPRAALPDFLGRARGVAGRYGLDLVIWGDAGVGCLHMHWMGSSDAREAAEVGACMAVLGAIGRELGGSPSTELGEALPAPRVVVEETPRRDTSTGKSLVLDELRGIVGPRYLLTRPADMATYETDASIAKPLGAPLAVALPATTDEVATLVRVCASYRTPIVTRGAGSGLAGGATPSPGALVIGLNRMEQITIDREQMVARVGAGAITAEVQRAAEMAGLFYPPDPSSQSASTIGGNIACNAGGPRCLKYGVTADYVLAVTAVLADGRVVRWGDGLAGQGTDNGLTQLLIGSEGTLGIITEATLQLIPMPAARRTTLAIFDSLDAACSTVEEIMAAGIIPGSLELMDDTTIAAVEAYLKLGLPKDAGAMLLMLADGEPEVVEVEANTLADLARAGGARQVQTARSAAEEAGLWKARRAVSIALTRVRPNRLGEDISVPLPQIASCVRKIKDVGHEHGLPIVVFGHAGDGNLHPNILFDAHDPAEVARIWPAAEGVFRVALEVGGTLSGEHGIGTLKRPFMPLAFDESALQAQRQIKRAFDPQNMLNPGKVLPE